jgi:adenylosuccinate synthase
LDIDHGVYPFVGNSSSTAGGALIGLGLGMGSVNRVIGVCNAYQTHPGQWPFPTEVVEDKNFLLRGNGNKPGSQPDTPTNSARRLGWLDGVLLRYAIQINGVTELAITGLSVLSGLDTLRFCTDYRSDDRVFRDLPLGLTHLNVEPMYEEFPGWGREILRARRWRRLPRETQRYIKFIEDFAGVPVRFVSVGPDADQIIEVK